MSRIGTFETKTRLPRLLRRDTAKVQAAIEDLKDFQRTHTLDGLSIRGMIEEGRERCQQS